MEKKTAAQKLDFIAARIGLYHGQASVSALAAVGSAGLAYFAHSLAAAMSNEYEIRAPRIDVVPGADRALNELGTKIITESAKSAVDAATIIYAHAIIDEVLMRLCRFSAEEHREKWLAFIEDRHVRLRDITTRTQSDIEATVLADYLNQLERESLLKKCEILFRLTNPPKSSGIIKGYTFKKHRVQEIDQLRHDLIHKLKFSRRIPQPAAKCNYLFQTASFFIRLLESTDLSSRR